MKRRVGPRRGRQEEERIVGVHLDLKGLAFRREYLPQLLADLAGQGVNAVLVEYEDVFPFRSVEVAWDRGAVWTRRVLGSFLAEAQRLGIEVIPLQQCLGHLEYVFRWNRYRRFAENPSHPTTLCLTEPGGRELVSGMLREVLEAHPASRYVHLGMDEAWSLATCPRCAALGDTLTVFLGRLAELCEVVERHGKTPIVWGDMMEHRFRPKPISAFRDRVIVCSWDYGSGEAPSVSSAMGGWRVRREWRSRPEDPSAPSIRAGQSFVQELPASVKREIRPHERGLFFDPLFQADVWTRHGFRVLGGAAVRFTADGPVVPRYGVHGANVRAWAEAIARTGQMGVIATSWARGDTLRPPNLPMEAIWPGIEEFTRAMGRPSKPFWPGIPAARVRRIIASLGRCREDWSVEDEIAGEMEALAGKVREHRYEWDSLIGLARVLSWRRRADGLAAECERLLPCARAVEGQWDEVLRQAKALREELPPLHAATEKHFSRRYAGAAFREWIEELFAARREKLAAMEKVCRAQRRKAAVLYGREGSGGGALRRPAYR